MLACGAYGSPLVLQRSGIGPAEELDRLGVAVAADLPVGEGLIDHPGAGAAWEPTEPSSTHDMDAFAAERPVFMGQVTVKAQSAACGRGLTGTSSSSPPSSRPRRRAAGTSAPRAFAMKPRSRGRVRARTRRPRAAAGDRPRLPRRRPATRSRSLEGA